MKTQVQHAHLVLVILPESAEDIRQAVKEWGDCEVVYGAGCEKADSNSGGARLLRKPVGTEYANEDE